MSNNKTFNIIKLGLVLTLYAAAACVGLAFVYGKTKAVIDNHETAALETAIKELFPTADGFNNITGAIVSSDDGVTFENQYSITQNNAVIGAAIQAYTASYGGPIKVLVGINADASISRVKILSHSDTPGLGANAAKENYYVDKKAMLTFYDQFAGKKVSDAFEPKADIITIAASTITSRAVSRAVRVAGRAGADWLRKTQGANDE